MTATNTHGGGSQAAAEQAAAGSGDSYIRGSSRDPLIHASINSLLDGARQESIL